MPQTQPAFGGMLRQLVDLGLFELDTEPLDALIERRLKEFWEYTTCPRCGHPSIHTWGSSDRVICRDCDFKPVYTYGTPFHEKHLTTGEVLLAYLLYADTLLSISQIAVVLDRAYKTVYYAIREVEAAVTRGFPLVWEQFQHSISGPTQIDESSTVCSGYKGQDPPRNSRYRGGSSRSGRSRWKGRHGDQITLVAACRDVLRVIRGHLGISYQGDLEPVLQEAEDLSQPLGEVWTDGLQAYREMEYDHRTVIHDERYVSADGVHINQVECLFSLVKPWLRKFRGLSKQGLEQAAHTFGIVRSVNLVGASLEIVVDCLATGSLLSST
ncbi:IS1595 family transposase (plasmid) [Salinigranum rubrum]|uniref:IS1595 family transposase n=1 Tax=Salinigranum rubrum TaxID=755307 RepID=A0A2I8VRH8_9EURY|nr:IS1595 family transposase [Salinigranum rubrum]AUV84523.1 IS1595 family transposase [Salinigranum rubrum]